ncbi:MAG TPA: phage tail protein [Solirubrobacteraceae bacterium]|nr:phage tail protein [Solirubrobacteraceae bacterium]
MSDAPATASARGYLRQTLPALYRDAPNGDEPVAVRFLAALEPLVDPVVALLDSLPAHFDPRLAPAPIVDGLGEALGQRPPAELPLDARRRLVEHALELAAKRGTPAGARRALELAFDGATFAVEDSGGVTSGSDPSALPDAAAPAFTVTTDPPPDAGRRGQIDRLMQAQCPAHVEYRPPRAEGDGG